jgi:hypothetical protein
MSAFTTHPRKLLLFSLLSLADLVLTCRLLQGGGGQVYEGNPVADWWLAAFGWTGLVSFKILTVLLAGGLATAISVHRPALGGKVLTFACTAVTGVLIYSCALALHVQEDPYSRAVAKAQKLDQEIQTAQRFQELVLRLGHDLLEQRRTLAEAVVELARSERAQDPAWLGLMRGHYPNRSVHALLASYLMEVAVELVEERSAAPQVGRQLRAEYQATFDREGSALDLAQEDDLRRSSPPYEME